MNGRIIAIKKAKPGARIERGCGAGYGFIKDESGVERFFHFNNTDIPVEELEEGIDVVFEPYTEPNKEAGKGERARAVTRA
jgi:cold shock CspA family protein